VCCCCTNSSCEIYALKIQKFIYRDMKTALTFDIRNGRCSSLAEWVRFWTYCLYVTLITSHSNMTTRRCFMCRLRLKCDGTRAETRFSLSVKRTSPFKSAGASVQSTTGSRGVRISGGNAGYTMFRGSVKSTDYPLNSPVSPSLPLPCVTVCHHISTGLYTLHSVD
jgi:hypothetical protein